MKKSSREVSVGKVDLSPVVKPEVKTEVQLVGIGEASKATNLSIAQIRYMEEIGLIQPLRSLFGQRQDRLYTEENIEVLMATKAKMDEHKCPISQTANVKGMCARGGK